MEEIIAKPGISPYQAGDIATKSAVSIAGWSIVIFGFIYWFLARR